MSLPSFERLMSHSVDLIKQTMDASQSLSDDTTYAGEDAFVQYGNERMVNDRGEEIHATAIVFLPSGSSFDPDHRYWRIEHGQRKMKVEAIEQIDDPRTGDLHHYELGVI